jgi:hypothetical protein
LHHCTSLQQQQPPAGEFQPADRSLRSFNADRQLAYATPARADTRQGHSHRRRRTAEEVHSLAAHGMRTTRSSDRRSRSRASLAGSQNGSGSPKKTVTLLKQVKMNYCIFYLPVDDSRIYVDPFSNMLHRDAILTADLRLATCWLSS